MVTDQEARGAWSSKAGFLLAAAGSAIGLGNIWRFTYIMGENGGAAFILVYVACIILIGVPLFLAELVLGRNTHLNPVGAIKAIKPGTSWKWIGALGVLAGALLLSFYSVVAGWVMAYALRAPFGTISELASPEEAGTYFDALSSSASQSLMFHGLFMIATVVIVARGIKGGIERASKIMMPILFILLAALAVRSMTLTGAGAGIDFMLRPDFSALTPSVVLIAMGHAFFTLSVGMGTMITYGSYLTPEHNLPMASLQVAFMDTLIAIVAGFAIFPALFAFGMEPTEGVGLVFVALPVVFHQMPGGMLFASMFFALFFMAALTSSISLLEVVAAYFIDELGWVRSKAVLILGVAIFLMGIPAALAMGSWGGWSIASMLGATAGQGALGSVGLFQDNWFDLISNIVSDYMLPVGGFFLCLLVGWFWNRATVEAEVFIGSPGFRFMTLWINLLRWFGPLLIGQVLVLGILAEFPQLAQLVDTLQAWFAGLDILVALVVIVVSLVAGCKTRSTEFRE